MTQGGTLLAGVNVLDLSRVLAAPHCTMALGELGARVIKVEHVRVGDETRTWGPPFVEGESAYYLAVNRNKQSVALDLATPVAQKVVRRLALSWADIVVENFKAGDLERFNLGLADLRAAQPRLITASIRGYPIGDDRPGYDFVIQGAGGLMSITGPQQGPPSKVGVAVADLFAGSWLLSGILAALYERERSGRGQHVSVSLFDSQLAMLANVASSYLVTGRPSARYGNAHAQLVPYEVFGCKDGEITVGVGNDHQFAAVCKVLGHPEWCTDERYATNPQRVLHRQQLVAEMGAALGQRFASEVLSALNAAGVPCGPIRSVGDALESPEAALGGAVTHLEHAKIRDLPQVRLPWRFSRSDASPRTAPPLHGEHTAEVLAEAGLSDEEIADALRSGAATVMVGQRRTSGRRS